MWDESMGCKVILKKKQHRPNLSVAQCKSNLAKLGATTPASLILVFPHLPGEGC